VVLVAAVAFAGCAAHQPPAPPAPTSPPVEKSAPTPEPTTVETWDKGLSAAMAALRQSETVDTLQRVAAEYLRLGVYDQAETYLSRAIKLDPRNAESWEARARAWRDLSLPERALTDAQRAVFYAPRSASARNTLGTVLFALNLPADAAQAFNDALALDPGASWARNNLCYISLLAGDATTALAQCSAAVKGDATLTVARNNLALVYAADGQLDAAQREFMAAGSPAEGHYNFGIVLMARKDYARAVAEFDAAGREDPKFEAAFTRAREARLLAARAAAGGK
jgi:Tfp pilus assembly protein PilF